MKVIVWVSLWVSILGATSLAHAASWPDDKRAAEACLRSAASEPDALTIHRSLALDAEPTARTFPTDADLASARRLFQSRQACNKMLLQAAKQHRPHFVPVVELRQFLDDLVVAVFLAKRITYGNAAQLFQQTRNEYVEFESDFDRADSDGMQYAIGRQAARHLRQARTAAAPLGTHAVVCLWRHHALDCEPY
jgi:hypothetical protein